MAEFVARAEQLGLTDPKQAAQEMLTRLDLVSLANQNPHDASGGEQQLIALGILLLSAPSVLLLDEPTKGLDPVRRQRLGKILKRLQQERGVTIVMVSHDMAFSARFADHCTLLFDGQIVSQAEPHQFFCRKFLLHHCN
ncbi:AAA family ATPase [Secundilactobacillus odoratitofui]|uniref:AAA family ATPase n=1 Tax=Secundilactobacillus odoratitofui TaxID=480930 RepID=UPI000B1ECE4B|nr:AAA family ATPase [Secundilactobacillus odoratitofui]